jgi:hypothetical protein
MNVVHIFNPETDFALASGAEYYTPPKNVVTLRRKLALTPALFARSGEYILLLDNFTDEEFTSLDYYDMAISKGVKILVPSAELPDDAEIKPWGWNLSLRRFLLNKSVDANKLPSEKNIEELRRLSHRRTTIPFLETVYGYLDYRPPYPLPMELSDEASVAAWCGANAGGYLKAPWSSSGRGIFRVLRSDGEDIRGWVRGTLRRQGSLLAEPGWRRAFDFATEWVVEQGSARFIGYSVFNVDDHSQYTGNVVDSQPNLKALIDDKSGGMCDSCVEAQRVAIETLIAPYYDGPMGIDCLIDDAGYLNPCVEINMRRTMGMVPLL